MSERPTISVFISRVRLADLFGASIHATFRRWIDDNTIPVCGLVLDPQPVSTSPQTFRRFELVESNSWTGRYGANRFPARLASTNYGFLGQLGLPGIGNIDAYWGLDDRNAEMTTVRVQSFCNTYRVFVLLWLPAKESFIARHRASPRLELC